MNIKALLVMTGTEVQMVKIPANIKFIKSLIGENLYIKRLDYNNIIIANKDADELDFNRLLNGKIIQGDFLIVSVKNKHRVSMKKRDIRRYKNRFQLKRHKKKIEYYRNKYIEQTYMNNNIEYLTKPNSSLDIAA